MTESSRLAPTLPQETILNVLGEMSEHTESALDDQTVVDAGADPNERAAFLTALNCAVDEASLEGKRESSVPFVIENEFLSQLQGLAQQRAEAAWADGRLKDPVVDLAQFREVVYDDRDLGGWIKSFFRWKRFGKHRFAEPPDSSVIAIPDDARIALFGDWGSGRYGAPVIGATLKNDPQPIHATIHLGDVYYCGLDNEVTLNMLGPWPFRDKTRNFALNGNHEMYGGGHGLWAAMQRFEQRFTYFALQNNHFTLIGLDSAVEDGDLYGKQASWVSRVIDAAGSRRVILLSHHQPYSVFDKSYGAMVAKLQPWLKSGRIAAWFWGHEHRCVVFDRNNDWGGLQGVCLGHGGYPYFRDQPRSHWSQVSGDSGSVWYRFPEHEDGRQIPSGLILGDGNPYVRDQHGKSLEMRYGAHGYAMLHLVGGTCTESFHRPDGAAILTRTL